MADPLSTLYDALWTMLEAHSGFTDLVRIGNRVKFAGEMRDPEKSMVLSADRPTVGILAEGGLPHLEATSNASFLTARFQIIVITGDLRLDEELYPVTWEIYGAMTRWHTALTALTWNGKTFVHLGRPTNFVETPVEVVNQGIRGWVGKWTYEVEMHFTTLDLIPK